MTRELVRQAAMKSPGSVVRRLMTTALLVIALAGSLLATGIILYVVPQQDTPSRSDVVVVLGPPTVQRLITAQGLIDDGLADHLVISVPAGVEDDDSHPRLRDLCRGATSYDVECYTPAPFTTQGEARLTHQLMTDNEWSSAIVVTSVSHITRARMLFDRCLDASGEQTAFVSDGRHYDLGRWIDEFFYQSGAFIKVALSPEC
jgi:hypothetical protein